MKLKLTFVTGTYLDSGKAYILIESACVEFFTTAVIVEFLSLALFSSDTCSSKSKQLCSFCETMA